MTEKNSRRLKSIIVVSYNYDKDERKEEDMVDDQDVYLRHEGSKDSGNRELGYNEESDSGSGRKTVGYDEFGEDNKSETSKAFHQDNSLKDDDLEAILKKRALENLKRFRGETQTTGIARKEVSSVSEGELRQIESEKTEESQDHGLMEQTKLCVSTDSRDFEDSQKILHEVDNVSESGTVCPDTASQQSGDTVKVKVSSGISSCSSKRKLIRPVLGQQESSLNPASGKEAAGCEDAEAESINGSTIDKNCPESSLVLATKNGGENIEPTKVSSTLNAQSSSHAANAEALDETRGESQSEQKTIGEAKDESQYEQKTMTVMRGGEMVQVSYKVYIPKKTSSLGRRQLKR
ncbi:unnamed protein product [Arabis nemorensis]|uniref:Uncharacterized protein n=1 Tax=Arabis nemorensis TaxID=586526 RepID=A0A565CR26_9BRAS|nr:unnamed protein product [Arabis nemorensis]